MLEKGKWISAETFLREASRREDEVLYGNPSPDRIVELEQLQTETTLDLMDATPPLSEKHSSGFGRFLSNDIQDRGTQSERTIEGFSTPKPSYPRH